MMKSDGKVFKLYVSGACHYFMHFFRQGLNASVHEGQI